MAHNLNVENGRVSAFFADNAAWHNLGQIADGLQTWEKAVELAQMNWEVEVRQLEWSGNPVNAWGTFRTDNNRFLGTVNSAKYSPIQMSEAFNFVDTVLDNLNGAHYEAAGILGNGERFWCLAKIPADFSIGNDEHKTYLMFASSHDGSLAAIAKLTDVRVVCQNTLQMALNTNGKAVKIKHTKNAKDKLEQAKNILNGTTEAIKVLTERLDFLANRNVTREGMEEIMNRLFPVKEDQKVSTRRDNILQEVLSLYESNDNNTFPEFKGTAYNLLNAITEYTDHVRGVRMTSKREGMSENSVRAENAIFGSGAVEKENAFEVIYEVAQSMPYKGIYARAIERGAAMRSEYEPSSIVDVTPSNDEPSLLDSILDLE
jgi:phage/plasmid-like protein (TIGR03299 family)